MISRRRALQFICGVIALPACNTGTAAVRVAAVRGSEGAIIAEVYAQAMERAHIPVKRRLRFHDSVSVREAIRQGDIDVYPGLIPAYEPISRTAGLTELAKSPIDSSACVVTTELVAQQYWLLDLSTCSKLAPKLRLAATPEFLNESGSFAQLRRGYGGFRFKSILTLDAVDQYYALQRGDVDVASGHSTDPQIAEGRLVILRDDKMLAAHFTYAPVVRTAALHAHPSLRNVLERVSGELSTFAVQQMNAHIDLLHMDSSEAAGEFLSYVR